MKWTRPVAILVVFGTISALYPSAAVCAAEAGGGGEGGEAIGAIRSTNALNRSVKVCGVVHTLVHRDLGGGRFRHAILVQDSKARADGDASTSDAIHVDLGETAMIPTASGDYRPRVGDELVLSGRLTMYRNQLQLGGVRLEKKVRAGVALAEELETVPILPPDDLTAAEAYWRQCDAMRCRIAAGASVTGPPRERIGQPDAEMALLPAGHPLLSRPDAHARRVFRDAHPLDDQPDALFDNGNGARIFLVGARLPPARVYSTLAEDVTGAVQVKEGMAVVLCDGTPAFREGVDPALNRPEPMAPASNRLAVAVFNVENLYDYVDDPFDANDFTIVDRGGASVLANYVPASDAVYRRRLAGLAQQIVRDLAAPDLLMVQEVEDQDIFPRAAGRAPADHADGIPDTLADLAAEIEKQGGPRYAAACDRQGTDDRGIVCAFMWRQDRLGLATPSADDPVLGRDIKVASRPGRALLHTAGPLNPRAVNATDPAIDREKPLMSRGAQAGQFEFRPAADAAPVRFYAICNHFKSRPNDFLQMRRAQAQFNADLVKALQDANGEALVLVGGDLNTFPRPDEPVPESPVDTLGPLYEAGLVCSYDVLMKARPVGCYTYVYQGQAQTLDQLLFNAPWQPRLRQMRVEHINADFPADPARPDRGVGDHDPVIAVFEF